MVVFFLRGALIGLLFAVPARGGLAMYIGLHLLFAFSYFGISGDTDLIQGICLVIGV